MATLFLLFSALMASPSVSYKLISRRDLLEGEVETASESEQPWILAPKHLEPGDLATVVGRKSKERVDPETYFIGMPPEITESFRRYAQDTGLMEIFRQLLYENPVDSGDNRVYKLDDGTNWAASRPANWIHEGDMTWIDPADEYTYELVLDIWRKGGFDRVLDTLGEKFGLDGLWIDGTSFIVVSKFNGYNMHDDLPGLGTKVFNIIFPIHIPESGPAQLLVADRDLTEELPINLSYNLGTLVGGDSKHGTGNCNYREAQDFRVAIAVYFDDINDENIDEFSSDTTAFFPPLGDQRWIYSQAGRHWGGENSLKNDRGRDPYGVKDSDEYDCPALAAKGGCESDMDVRNGCLKTCKVYLDDKTYYETLGKFLNWPADEEEG